MADDVDRYSCDQTRTIGTPPLTVTLGCRREVKHTGKHVTPGGDCEWWGPTDQQLAAKQASRG